MSLDGVAMMLTTITLRTLQPKLVLHIRWCGVGVAPQLAQTGRVWPARCRAVRYNNPRGHLEAVEVLCVCATLEKRDAPSAGYGFTAAGERVEGAGLYDHSLIDRITAQSFHVRRTSELKSLPASGARLI